MVRHAENHSDLRRALVDAADDLLAEEGPTGLSVRSVASRVGTTTQAVYTLFGSKDGLLGALALRLYELIGSAIERSPSTDDPARDLAEVAVTLRGVIRDHPSLYRVTFQRIVPGVGPTLELQVARQNALNAFRPRFERLVEADLLPPDRIDPAMLQFSALIEGLANGELRGDVFRLLPWDGQDHAWRDAAATLIRGFTGAALRVEDLSA